MPAGQRNPPVAVSKGPRHKNAGKAVSVGLPAWGSLPGGDRAS